MKKIVKSVINVIMLTIGFPITFFLALGYWTHSDDDTTFIQSIKNVL